MEHQPRPVDPEATAQPGEMLGRLPRTLAVRPAGLQPRDTVVALHILNAQPHSSLRRAPV
jgi:hypothetical protein